MAGRLPDEEDQMQQSVNQSRWSCGEVRAALPKRVETKFISGIYWLHDEISFPQQREDSLGVAPQYRGALETANFQVAVTLGLGTEDPGTPMN